MFCELGGSEGLKNKEKGDLKRKKECTKLTTTRSRYVSVQNTCICVQHNKCTFPKSYENWCPVYSNSFTTKLKNAVCYFLKIS